jgi:hypothetical protein
MFGRFIIGMISSSGLVTAASIMLGAAEVTGALTLGVRDKFIYSSCNRCGDRNTRGDPLVSIKAKKLMRARNAHMETQLEVLLATRSSRAPALAAPNRHDCSHLLCVCVQIIFIVLMGFVVPIAYDLSSDGKQPNVGTLFANTIVQILIELVVDLIIVSWLTTKCKQPVIAVTHLSFKGTTIFLCTICFWACTTCIDLVLVKVAGMKPGTESTFVYYSTEGFFNVTATGLAGCD